MFVLDTSIFVDIKDEYYAGKVAPGFSRVLIGQAKAGNMKSIDLVQSELLEGNDDLAEWAKTRFAFAFASTDDAQVLKWHADILDWADKRPQYTQGARDVLLENADGWLVAYAKAYNAVVATGEKSRPDRQVNIHIPDICNGLKVPVVDLHKMLHQLGIKLP